MRRDENIDIRMNVHDCTGGKLGKERSKNSSLRATQEEPNIYEVSFFLFENINGGRLLRLGGLKGLKKSFLAHLDQLGRFLSWKYVVEIVAESG